MNAALHVLGGMAGSSMDGLDLVLAKFYLTREKWNFEIVQAETIDYPDRLLQELKQAPMQDRKKHLALDESFGTWIGQVAQDFLSGRRIDLAAIHGHTLIHRPAAGISWQLGSGPAITAILKVPTIVNFRSEDIHQGGQGAPLVPVGDFELFEPYDACLNLGGICNISIRNAKLAWDVSPCNQVLNFFSQQLGQPYDASGELARGGTMDHRFFESLSQIAYFSKKPPKSLPNQFIDEDQLRSVSPQSGLHTFTCFLATRLGKELAAFSEVKNLLITGGGAFNDFLVEQLRRQLKEVTCEVPNSNIVCFKEALIFAFLGVLRFRGEINVLASVTGARRDSTSGVIHIPK